MIQVDATKANNNYIEVCGLTQWDRGQKIEISGLSLPSAVEIHFASQDGENAKVMVGSSSEGKTTAEIPDELLKQGLAINAYIYLSDSTSGETVFIIHLPVVRRAKPNEYVEDPNPENPFGEIVEQVKDYADSAAQSESDAKEHLDKIEQDLQDATDVIENLETKTQAGSTLNETLEDTIASAETSKTNLTGVIDDANTANSTLSSTISDANAVKTQLSDLTDDASLLKQNIDKVVQDAEDATSAANTAAGNANDAADAANQAAENANAAASGELGTKSVTFQEATNKENIVSGETLSVLFGKIQKWIAEQPESLKNPYTLSISLNGGAPVSYDGSSEKSINITAESLGAPLESDFVEITDEEIEALFNDE